MPPTRLIRLDTRLHDAGEDLPVSDQLCQVLAWWVASELVRRHPRNTRVIEAHPAGGSYDCLAVYGQPNPAAHPEAWARIVYLHKRTGCHLTPGSWFGQTDPAAFNWLEVLLHPDRRRYVIEQLERSCGLAVPKRSPATSAQSVGPRIISGFLTRGALSKPRWTWVNGLNDSSYGSETRDWLFNSVGGMSRHRRTRRADDLLGTTEYRYWFLVESKNLSPDLVGNEPAHLAIDTMQGVAWRNGRRLDLMAEYQKVGRSIDALVSRVCPPAT